MAVDLGNIWDSFSKAATGVSDTLGGVTKYLGTDSGKGLVNAGSFLTDAYFGYNTMNAMKDANKLALDSYNNTLQTVATNDDAANDAVSSVFGAKKKEKSPFAQINTEG